MVDCNILALSGCLAAEKCKFLKIVKDLSVVLEGWPLDEPLSHPSTLGNTVGKLEMVCNVLINRTCKFHRISAEERVQRYQEWHAKITNGEIININKRQKECSDKGILKGPLVPCSGSDDDDGPSNRGQGGGIAFNQQCSSGSPNKVSAEGI
ncbi:hypothetical protein FISHEDRAFT_75783 [Fistulina hepatica ATCC 64428]|uniref:Uncharacterized protein n=1 Tax=Fistulina hepatica ATCC 64428 TaxID=1128425 RepID=A0A0D7A7B5_9AGAR|nr:hypothetical protein FISHEDRAFT_75783 [Fistulina hepatica ATCC 64428]